MDVKIKTSWIHGVTDPRYGARGAEVEGAVPDACLSKRFEGSSVLGLTSHFGDRWQGPIPWDVALPAGEPCRIAVGIPKDGLLVTTLSYQHFLTECGRGAVVPRTTAKTRQQLLIISPD